MTKARTLADNYAADISGITAGTGITGGGTSGTVTITNEMATTITAKGDLLAGTGNATFDNLAAGNSGETLVADSSTTTGLRWQGDYAAGKNLVINGNMNIAQRGTSLTSLSTGETYLIDRFIFRNNNLGTATYSQETDAPAGFKTSAKILFTTADNTPAASDFSYFRYKFEGQQLQALQKGTATAKPTTLSFWVKSNVTGTYVVNFADTDNTRLICGSYTINSSATWEKKTITIAGDTTGALENDNAISFIVDFALGAGTDRTSGTLQTTWGATVTANAQVGQVNVAATLNNYWMITGIQWEIGSVATDFSLAAGNGNIAGELAACMRYYQRLTGDSNQILVNYAFCSNSTLVTGQYQYIVPMRTVPTALDFSNVKFRNHAGSTFAMSSLAFNEASAYAAQIYGTISGGTAEQPGSLLASATTGYIGLSAEL